MNVDFQELVRIYNTSTLGKVIIVDTQFSGPVIQFPRIHIEFGPSVYSWCTSQHIHPSFWRNGLLICRGQLHAPSFGSVSIVKQMAQNVSFLLYVPLPAHQMWNGPATLYKVREGRARMLPKETSQMGRWRGVPGESETYRCLECNSQCQDKSCMVKTGGWISWCVWISTTYIYQILILILTQLSMYH